MADQCLKMKRLLNIINLQETQIEQLKEQFNGVIPENIDKKIKSEELLRYSDDIKKCIEHNNYSLLPEIISKLEKIINRKNSTESHLLSIIELFRHLISKTVLKEAPQEKENQQLKPKSRNENSRRARVSSKGRLNSTFHAVLDLSVNMHNKL